MNTTPLFDRSTNEGWLDELAFRLRMLDVDGRRTGAAVAEARSHLAESGENALVTFGSPDAYAEALALPERKSRLRTAVGTAFVGAAAYAAATLLMGLVLPDGVVVRLGNLLAVVVLALFGLSLLMLSRALRAHLRFLLVWVAVVFVGMTLVGILLTQPLFTVPGPAAVVAGVVLLAAAGAYLWRITVADPYVEPGRGGPRGESGGLRAQGSDD